MEDQNLYDKWFDYFSVIDIHEAIPQLPEISNLQEKIKLSSRQIFTKYYDLDHQVRRIEEGIETPSDDFVEELKKERLHLKDELFEMIKTA